MKSMKSYYATIDGAAIMFVSKKMRDEFCECNGGEKAYAKDVRKGAIPYSMFVVTRGINGCIADEWNVLVPSKRADALMLSRDYGYPAWAAISCAAFGNAYFFPHDYREDKAEFKARMAGTY